MTRLINSRLQLMNLSEILEREPNVEIEIHCQVGLEGEGENEIIVVDLKKLGVSLKNREIVDHTMHKSKVDGYRYQSSKQGVPLGRRYQIFIK